jgi:hypothetical protein
MRTSALPVPRFRPLRPVPRSRPLRTVSRSRRLRPLRRSDAYLRSIIRDSRDDDSPALGLVCGALISVPIWAVVIWAFL